MRSKGFEISNMLKHFCFLHWEKKSCYILGCKCPSLNLSSSGLSDKFLHPIILGMAENQQRFGHSECSIMRSFRHKLLLLLGCTTFDWIYVACWCFRGLSFVMFRPPDESLKLWLGPNFRTC